MTHPEAIGPYIIEREIARGGMGIVYLARDDRLDRTVAIKSLPTDLAESAERLARFEREAKALAALNHTNIAGIHSVEEFEGARYLVLEYVEGLTLSERIAQGPLPIDEAMEIAGQIALGIEAAHEAGVIHRDLKPGNVIVRPDGVVKVVDFGLAKEIESGTSSLDLTNMPTATIPNEPVSVVGQVLGTPAFLSPEQARGKQVDRRTDIWSFGCVLFECLTGERLFGGETSTDALAAILEREPRWETLPDNTPPRIRELLRSCLEKDPRSRLRDIGDARLEIERALANKEWSATNITAYTGKAGKPRRLGAIVAIALIAFALGAGVMFLLPDGSTGREQGDDRTIRYTIDAAKGSAGYSTLSELAISNDGRMIAYTRYDGATDDHDAMRRVFVHDVSSTEPWVVPGLEETRDTFFSPDGRRLGFRTNEALKIAPVRGGPTTTVHEQYDSSPNAGAWLENDEIVFSSDLNNSLSIVSIGDGAVRSLCRPSQENGFLGFEEFCPLPNGKGSLVSGWTGHTIEDYSIAHLAPDGELTVLIEDAAVPRIIGGRYLVFIRRSTLFVAPFDADHARLTGDPVPVIEGVKALAWGGSAYLDVSPSGDLVYQPGKRETTDRRLVWINQSGEINPVGDSRDAFFNSLTISGDGRWAAVSTLRNKNELWLVDLETGAMDRIWDDDEPANAILNHDGSRIAFNITEFGGDPDIVVVLDLHSGSDPQTIMIENYVLTTRSWLPGSDMLLIDRVDETTLDNDLVLLDTATQEITELLSTPQREVAGVVSPDGKWLAFGSDRSGEYNLYVQAYPGNGPARLISPGGAFGPPFWSGDSKAIHYANHSRMHVVELNTGSGLSLSKPRALFSWPWPDGLTEDRQMTMAPDGRFLMIEPAEWEKEPPRLIVVRNWLTELDERFGRN